MAVSLGEVVSFGRYEPLFRLASGGMAEVYAARIRGEAGFQKLVAVKRMHPHLANDSGFVDMFLNEARLAAHIASPHVVSTLDLGRGGDGALYIVMELVVGIALADAGEAIDVAIACELVAQAAQGIDDAHEATLPSGEPLGLIHRDVSPHNILIGIDGRARVTDFGIAHAIHRPRAETNVKQLKGKFAYMSPEQTRLRPLDRRTDVFSLGIVLWETLTGQRLFADPDPLECVHLVRKKPVPRVDAVRKDVPPQVADVVARALDRDPQERWQTAGDMADALRGALRAAGLEVPDRKRLARFVEGAGGEELERLRRLIRLGSEGASAEAMEAVQPGATRVLGTDASGVAPAGHTSLLEDESPAIPTVHLDAAELPESERLETEDTHSTEVRAGDASSEEVPTSVLDLPDEPPTTKAKNRAPAGRAASRWALAGAAAVVAALCAGVGLAVVLLLPGRDTHVLPAVPIVPGASVPAAPVPLTPAPIPAEPSTPEPSTPEPSTPEPSMPEPSMPEPSTPAPAARLASPAQDRAPPSTRPAARSRRPPRRPATRATPPVEEPAAPAPAARPVLMDVSEFDRRPR